MHSSVVLERCLSYRQTEVDEAVQKVLSPLGGLNAFIRSGDRVILKPNLLAPKSPERAVTTHPAVVEAVVKLALDCGAKVSIGDSPPLPSAHRMARGCGIAEVARRLGVPIIDFRSPTTASRAPQIHTREIQSPRIDKTLLEADVVINLPKLKTHCQMLVTCAVKNLFGCIVGRRKALQHFRCKRSPDDFAAMLLANMEKVGSELTLVDAVMAMEGMGPSHGTPKPLHLLISGQDPVAVDRVVAELLKIDWRDHFVLRTAHRLGFSGVDLASLTIAGFPLDQAIPDTFELPELMPIGFSIPHLIKGIYKYCLNRMRKERPRSAS